jgi:pantetheine-phosphate adenylyltransferase
MRKKPYKIVGLGGTFDHFHDGHKAFIDFAANLGGKILIGVTTQEMIQTKDYLELIEPLRVRKHAVMNYCRQKKYICEVFTLYDIYGSTIEENSGIGALAVTEETERGAIKINETRKKLGFRELAVFSCPLVFDLLHENHIHSVRIRAGEISRRGEVYDTSLRQTLTLSESQRAFFNKPQGPIVQAPPEETPPLRVVVGDASTERFTTQKWPFSVGVFDNKIQRKKIEVKTTDGRTTLQSFSVKNVPGSISLELTTALKKVIYQGSGMLEVTGEEDLATVASVLLLPLGSEVYYGQPNKGLVQLVVTEALKISFFTALNDSKKRL